MVNWFVVYWFIGLLFMVYGLWFIDLWFVGYGLWFIGSWSMVYGLLVYWFIGL